MLTAKLEALRRHPGASVLDIGCGEGRHCHGIQMLTQARAIGVDLDTASLRIAAARARDLPGARAEFQQADAGRLPFADASAGGAGLATLLGVTLLQVQSGHLTLQQALALLTCNPARWLGLDAGTLRKGAPADLCLFHPELSWQVEAGKLPGKAQNTPFDGRALEGKLLGTWKAGKRGFG